MRHKIIARTFPLLLAASSLLALPLLAQETDAPSVAEAARRAREQKKNSTKPAKVVTDDTLHPESGNPSAPPAVSQPGQPSAPSDSGAANAAGAPAQGNEAPSQEDVEAKKKAIEALKQQIAEKQSEVDLAQRELTLENDNYYSKPDFSRDKDGKAKLDGMQADLNTKKDELAQLKAKLADLGGVEEPKAPATVPSAPNPPANP